VITAVVLAAGTSSRFGSPKQAVLLEPVLERVRRSRAVDEILVVLGAHELATSARAVRCADWRLGPGASLRCGLATLHEDVEAAVVILGDGPELDPRAIDRVVAAWRISGSSRVAAAYEGTRLHPLLLARQAWADIPDGGLRGLSAELVHCDDLRAPGDVDFVDQLPDGLRSRGGSHSPEAPAEPCSPPPPSPRG
jgi:CTP:molybdopterin cytidylyltransferase MocA